MYYSEQYCLLSLDQQQKNVAGHLKERLVTYMARFLEFFECDENCRVLKRVYGIMWTTPHSAGGLARLRMKPFSDQLDVAELAYWRIHHRGKNQCNQVAIDDFQSFIRNPFGNRDTHHPWGVSLLAQTNETTRERAVRGVETLLSRHAQSAVLFWAMADLVEFEILERNLNDDEYPEQWRDEPRPFVSEKIADDCKMFSDSMDSVAGTFSLRFSQFNSQSVPDFCHTLDYVRLACLEIGEIRENIADYEGIEIEQNQIDALDVVETVQGILQTYCEILYICESVFKQDEKKKEEENQSELLELMKRME